MRFDRAQYIVRDSDELQIQCRNSPRRRSCWLATVLAACLSACTGCPAAESNVLWPSISCTEWNFVYRHYILVYIVVRVQLYFIYIFFIDSSKWCHLHSFDKYVQIFWSKYAVSSFVCILHLKQCIWFIRHYKTYRMFHLFQGLGQNVGYLMNTFKIYLSALIKYMSLFPVHSYGYFVFVAVVVCIRIVTLIIHYHFQMHLDTISIFEGLPHNCCCYFIYCLKHVAYPMEIHSTKLRVKIKHNPTAGVNWMLNDVPLWTLFYCK